MRSISDPSQDSGSYLGLLKRLTQRVQQGTTEVRLLELIRDAFDLALADEKIVLSQPEISRLARQVSRAVLADVVSRIDAHGPDKLPL